MRLKLDRSGRVRIPKAMRESLGLDPGSIVEIVVDDDRILLRRVTLGPGLALEDGILVATGKWVGDDDHVLDEIREERARRGMAWPTDRE